MSVGALTENREEAERERSCARPEELHHLKGPEQKTKFAAEDSSVA